MMKKRYVVILEVPDTGYMECAGVFDSDNEAFGDAYMALIDGLEPGDYYVTLPEYREGENGFVMEVKRHSDNECGMCATVLFYSKENTKAG